MGAPEENQYWRLRKDMTEDGRKISLNDLEIKLQEYIDRCVNTKLKEQQIHKRKISRDEEKIEKIDCDKRISMSVYGACVCIGIAHSTWYEWREDKKYSDIISRAEDIFKSWNIEGAAAGFLNPNIIARLEGLKDNTDITSGGGKVESHLHLNYKGKEIDLSE